MTGFEFARMADAVVNAARRLDLTAPSFKSRPADGGPLRTVSRRDRGAMIAVVVAHRPDSDVVADAVAGVALVNGGLTEAVQAELTAVAVDALDAQRCVRMPAQKRIGGGAKLALIGGGGR